MPHHSFAVATSRSFEILLRCVSSLSTYQGSPHHQGLQWSGYHQEHQDAVLFCRSEIVQQESCLLLSTSSPLSPSRRSTTSHSHLSHTLPYPHPTHTHHRIVSTMFQRGVLVAMASTLLLQSTMGFLRPSTALPATRVAAAAGLRLSQTRRSMAMISTETKGAAETEEFRVFFNVRLFAEACGFCRLWGGGGWGGRAAHFCVWSFRSPEHRRREYSVEMHEPMTEKHLLTNTQTPQPTPTPL